MSDITRPNQLILLDNTFYILETSKVKAKTNEKKKEISLHVGLNTAVNMIHEHISQTKESDNILLMKTTVTEKGAELATIPWSTIAVELVKLIKK